MTTNVNGPTMLYVGAWYDHPKLVRHFLSDARTNVNLGRTDYEDTPLTIATIKGNYVCAQLLAGHPHVDVNKADINGLTPLMAAAHMGHHDILELLLMDDLPSLVDHHPAWRKMVVTSLLCGNNTTQFFGSSLKKLPILVWRFIFSFFRPRTYVNQVLVTKESLSTKGVQLGLVPGASALWLAAAAGKTLCVEHLLAHADIDMRRPDAAGRTSYQIAQENGHAACATLLLTAGAV